MEAVAQTAIRPASGHAPAWVKERREHAAKRFEQVGYPTVRNEDWRFTNIAPIADATFAAAEGSFAQAASLVEAVNVPGAMRLTIVNGQFAADLSDLTAMPKGLRKGAPEASSTTGPKPLAGAVNTPGPLLPIAVK